VYQNLITVTISDDGIGFNPESELTGFGLTLTIDTGTIITINIPLP